MLSELGSQGTTVAMPLLVLALTGSAARAGLIGFARALAYPLTTLPAGVLADRVDRRRLLIGCFLARGVAMGSVPLVLLLGRPPLAQLMAVTFADAALWSVAQIAERGLLPAVVGPAALPDAVAANEARSAVGVVGGPPLGGALLGLARTLPFAADALSSLAAGALVAGVRPGSDPGAGPRGDGPPPADGGRALRQLVAEIREGVTWLWARPFLRDGSLLYAALNVTISAAALLAVLVARHAGASSAAVGLAFAGAGVGGILGAALAGPVRARIGTRAAVLAEPFLDVVLIPALLLCHSALAVGVLLGLYFLPLPLSSSVIVGRRLALAPPHLRGRVQASASFLGGSIGWLGPLAVGVVYEGAGQTAAILALSGWAALVALGAVGARGLRRIPAGDASGG